MFQIIETKGCQCFKADNTFLSTRSIPVTERDGSGQRDWDRRTVMETGIEAVKEKVVGQTKKEEGQGQRNMDGVTQKATGREGQEQWDRNSGTGTGTEKQGEEDKNGDRNTSMETGTGDREWYRQKLTEGEGQT